VSSRNSSANLDDVISPAEQYDKIAELYDELMSVVPYDCWVDYIHQILHRFNHRPTAILDLCCGTGNVSVLLARQGYQVTGVDISSRMIEVARQKPEARKGLIDFHVQDACNLRLGRKFDLVISLFDSLNYVLNSSDLQHVFYRVHDHLKTGGMFIFDMNTEAALAGGLFNQNNFGSNARVLYDWRSTYDPGKRICRIDLNFVYRKGGAEIPIKAVHYQRAYYEQEITEMLSAAGLEVLAVYHAYTFKKASKKSDRVFFVARK
jgi:SAM-dependent methyltransferase